MRHTLIALPALLLATTAPANANPAVIVMTCAERSLGSDSECACLQTLADDTIRVGLHDLIAEYLGRQINTAAIAAERGHSGAEQLASEAYLFRRKALKQCNVDLPKANRSLAGPAIDAQFLEQTRQAFTQRRIAALGTPREAIKLVHVNHALRAAAPFASGDLVEIEFLEVMFAFHDEILPHIRSFSQQ